MGVAGVGRPCARGGVGAGGGQLPRTASGLAMSRSVRIDRDRRPRTCPRRARLPPQDARRVRL